MRRDCHPRADVPITTKQHSHVVISAASSRPSAIVDTGRLIVALDGCIYNRQELGPYESDTELVAKMYEKAGFIPLLEKLNGDFAIALFDRDDQSLWLARDRFGVKPLYYSQASDQFAFASRPRALLQLPFVRPEVNRRFVAIFAGCHYRYFDNDPDASPYADVLQLPAGHALKVRHGNVSKFRYWSLNDLPDWSDNEEDLSRQYRDLLLDAVSVRLRTCRTPAFTLSGGMDSSSVLACAVHTTESKQPAFSTVYSDATYDEAQEIATMLDSAVSPWHTVRVDNPDVFAVVDQMIRVHDEPVATATWLSHYLLCQQAARGGFTSLFGGLGGDELNAGEFEHFIYFFADLRRLGADNRLEVEIQKWIEYHDHPIYRKSQQLVEDQLHTIVDLRSPGRCLPDRRRLLRYRSAVHRDYYDLVAFEPAMEHPFCSYLKNRTYQDLTRETIPCCLRADDRNCCAFGVDARLPFLDHRLVEFMFRVPVTLKYQQGVTKSLLRHAMKHILNEATRTRVKKTGWNAPAHRWFAENCREQLWDLIRSQAFRERGIYNVDEVERIATEHHALVACNAPRDNHMMFLWQCINIHSWLGILSSSGFEA